MLCVLNWWVDSILRNYLIDQSYVTFYLWMNIVLNEYHFSGSWGRRYSVAESGSRITDIRHLRWISLKISFLIISHRLQKSATLLPTPVRGSKICHQFNIHLRQGAQDLPGVLTKVKTLLSQAGWQFRLGRDEQMQSEFVDCQNFVQSFASREVIFWARVFKKTLGY